MDAVTDLDSLKRSRRPLRAQLAKRINELEAELSRAKPDRTVIQVKLEMIQKNYEKVDSLDQDIMSLVSQHEDAEQDAELLAISEYEEKYRTAKIKGDNFLEVKSSSALSSLDDASSASHISGAVHMKTYKLPKIEIRKFDGDLREWLGFWSQFQKIHEDSALHASDKFQYLIQSMEPGTRAYKLVNSYPQSAENYQSVVAALKDRFGDKVLLTEVYVRQLLKLVIRNVGKPKNVTLSAMYDEIESHLRALETLGVTQEQSAAFLYPLVESSLPEELIRVWQRSAMAGYDEDHDDKPVDERLKLLMKFLRKEVKGAERLSYVNEGFGEPIKEKFVKDRRVNTGQQGLPTAAGLFAGHKGTCIFCDKLHDSQTCVTAQSMPYGLKKRKILEKKACLACLKVGHTAKICKSYLKCIICQKRHVPLMCPDVEINKKTEEKSSVSNNTEQPPVVLSQVNCTNEVLLQTLRCIVRNGDKQKEVRVLLDPGSQRSYILERTAHQLSAKSIREVKLCHLLFGGLKEVQQHHVYDLEVGGCNNNFSAPLEVLGHQKICGRIPKMSKGAWMAELKSNRIFVNDLGEDESEIELLIGSDYYAKWVTGRKQFLKNGLVALETCFGWTLSGKLDNVPDEASASLAMQVTSMFVAEADVSELWDLEAIGIHDPVDQKTRDEKELAAKEHFLQTVTQSEEGRYIVSLPWIHGRPEIPNNRYIAEKRLMSMTAKLQASGKYEEYQKVFDDWLNEGIIEPVNEMLDKKGHCHYLPHRAVFKPESQTTPVRPVFDASCKTGRSPSLNELLEKGPNLLELLPTILLRFRENKIGVIADIRKAFQMIEVNEHDRDYLRFLWWEDPVTQKFKVYRHKRVVFGVNSSPFLLAAVITFHLKNVSQEQELLAEKLLKSLYVDNCATSVDSYEEYELFKNQVTEMLCKAKMHLRNWECTQQTVSSTEYGNIVEAEQCVEMNCAQPETQSVTKVLGVIWNKLDDTLSCEIPAPKLSDDITKRVILSHMSMLFDPVGFICPAVLPLKMILQSAWLVKLGWDDRLPEEAVTKFRKWQAEAQCLQKIKVRRDITMGQGMRGRQIELHTFCDASQDAYAAVIYLRVIDECGRVSVQLVMAKSRLAPQKRPTIPRMELLACVVGARLTNFVKDALNLNGIVSFLWSDSTTALAWIKGNNEWGTFIGNRVKEICTLTKPEDWRHVPGVNNPADLPSRGCSPSQLFESRWWEGPQWLYKPKEDWPTEEVVLDEDAIMTELKKTTATIQKMKSVDMNRLSLVLQGGDEHESSIGLLASCVAEDNTDSHLWYLLSSSYVKNMRVVAWIKRFVSNIRPHNVKQAGNLTVQEVTDAETTVLGIIQQEFVSQNKATKGLVIEMGKDGLYHVKTKLTHKDDVGGFRFPVLLQSSHPMIMLLIRWYHVKYRHAGAQFLMGKLRERFWILQSRRAINRVIYKCPTCLRHSQRSFQVDPAALPSNRTETSCAFQTTGVDLAGPLYLKHGEKVWLVLFTCAVYRCVHLDFVTALSTEAFLRALERFINIRGRPTTMYSDNGTNFVGLVNLFSRLNWQMIEETAHIKQIKWIFNPPSAAWWGGWWERLIRTVKDLLKRMLGKARLDYDQLRTSLSHAENVINERPLTVVTEDGNDLIPLTPAMFLRGIRSAAFSEVALLEADFQEEFQKRQSLQQELKIRFRNEYLALLVQRAKEKSRRQPKVGDVVLVGADDQKRLHWPMARIIELIPGRDGAVRVAKVKTQHGVWLRPLQRLYPLEVSSSSEAQTIAAQASDAFTKGRGECIPVMDSDQSEVRTRSGRTVNKPKRLTD